MHCSASILGLVLFQVALIAGVTAAGDDVRGHAFTGRVVLQLDGEPVRDARVQFIDGAGNLYETVSDHDGLFSLILGAEDTAIGAEMSLPGHFALGPAYPNPFNPSTTIPFDLPRHDTVRLRVYDVLGRAVRDLVSGELPAGTWGAVWNGLDDRGRPVAAGVYLYHLRDTSLLGQRQGGCAGRFIRWPASGPAAAPKQSRLSAHGEAVRCHNHGGCHRHSP